MGSYYDKLNSVFANHALDTTRASRHLKYDIHQTSFDLDVYNIDSYSAFAEFQLRRPLDKLSNLLAHNFIVDLYRLYGKEIYPNYIEDGCTSLKLSFSSASDYQGRNFQYLILFDELYQEFFASYDVEKISLDGFDADLCIRDNISAARFRVDSLGRPHPF